MQDQEEPGYAYINKPGYDLARLRKAFSSESFRMATGLSHEEKKQFILEIADKTRITMKQTIFYIHGANATPDSFTYLLTGMPEAFGFNYALYDAKTMDLGEIITEVRDQIIRGDENVHIVGHSLGGVIGVNVALMIPQRVKSVTTLATPFHGVELPMFVRMLHWYHPFVQNIIPTNVYYKRSRHKPYIPLQVIQTCGGDNPFLGYPNDGIVSLTSQEHPHATKVISTSMNHFEVLLHPSIRNYIVDFIGDVEDDKYK